MTVGIGEFAQIKSQDRIGGMIGPGFSGRSGNFGIIQKPERFQRLRPGQTAFLR